MGGQSKIVKALGVVKDQTSISLAKVSNDDTVLADIDVAIVKATRHEECPADERYVREILSLTCYSRAYVSACVHTLSRRLNKTKNWIVALKTLMLIHRLVSEGDSAYEQEIYIATRRGSRLLNLSDFRDTARSSGSWDFSSFVRTYGLYLDERLEYRMQSRRRRSHTNIPNVEGETKDSPPQQVREDDLSSVSAGKHTKKKLERVFIRAERLQLVLERFLACRPTGEAKANRMVIIALYLVVKESFQIYYDLAKIICFFVEQFMELDVPVCTRVHELFTRIGKQFEDLDVFYEWCKSMGIARSGDYPEIEKITHQKLEIMEEFIREKSNLVIYKRAMNKRQESMRQAPANQEDDEKVNPDEIKALPPPEDSDAEKVEEDQNEDNKLVECKKEDEKEDDKEADLLNLFDDETMARSEEQVNKLALALFDGWSTEVPTNTTTSGSAWTAFEEDSGGDWETALVESTSHLSNQQATLGGGFDMLVLDGMYQQSIMAPLSHETDNTGSASSVALRPVDPKQPVMLALPSSSTPNEASTTGSPWVDPFAASTSVAPPSYVQMSEMEKKQKLLVEEQLMWQQYGANGMQGHINGLTNTKQPGYYAMGGYT